MAKYTHTIEDILNNGIDLGLDSYPIFDETYRVILNTKIINHYRFGPEIGFETIERFKFELNQKMQEIMPFYNQMYDSALLKLDPFKTYDRKSETFKKATADDLQSETREELTEGLRKDKIKSATNAERESKDQTLSTGNQKVENDSTVDNKTKQIESETPTDLLLNGEIEGDVYATKAIVKEDDNLKNDVSTSLENSKQDSKSLQGEKSLSNQDTISDINSSLNALLEKTIKKLMQETFTSIESGFDSISQSELLLKYRETFLNIDMMIIEDLRCKFMYLF